MGDDSRQKDNVGLEEVRSQIDDIDLKIQDLLNERAKCAEKVADIKLSDLTQEASSRIQTNLFYRPEREAQVLRKIAGRNDGPMKSEALVTIFREIMSACLSLEKPLQISYLGPQGTFSQAAALKHFGHAVECKPVSTIDEVFAHVESGQSDFGVVPVENSTEGMVNNTLDNFMDSPLKISGEVEVRIEHHL
ncbi:MAG: chorismate mutase, partial [Halieaceae bacterium]|nr:chorismate mutase [Halieaceae bacterium]